MNEIGEEMVFNAKYSPMFSPIEELFSLLKNSMKKKDNYADKNDLFGAFLESLKEISPSLIQKLYTHSLNSMKDLLEGKLLV